MVHPKNWDFLRNIGQRVEGPQTPLSDEEKFKIDPELAKKLADQEIKRTLDPDYDLTVSAKRKAAAQLQDDAERIRRRLESGATQAPEDMAEIAATLAGEGVPPEEASKMAREGKGVKVIKVSKEEEKGKKKWSVSPEGQIFPDPEGEFSNLSEAFVAAHNLKSLQGPSFFYFDPQSGKYERSEVPIFPAQPSSKVIQVNPDGSTKEINPGEPIIITPQLQNAPGTPATIVVKPDGSWERHEPGQPIVINPPVPQQRETLFPLPQYDKEGKAIGYIPLTFDQNMQWQDAQQKYRHDEEKHGAIMGILSVLKEEIPRGVRTLGEMQKLERHQQPGQQRGASQSPEQPVMMDRRRCETCGYEFGVPRGAKDVYCPNPNCPDNKLPEQQR